MEAPLATAVLGPEEKALPLPEDLGGASANEVEPEAQLPELPDTPVVMVL